MKYTTSIRGASAGLLTTVSAHGLLTSPTPHHAGTAMEAACEEQSYSNQASDSYGNIQGELQVAATQTDYNAADCDIWLCKAYKFADNTANVQSWTAGQVVDFYIIGDILLVYDDFADNAKTILANETSFSITIPNDLGDTCATPGACVLQHYWNAASIDPTYESCVDFTVDGSGLSSGSSSSSASVSVAAISSTVVKSSSKAVSSATSTKVSGTTTSVPVSVSSSKAAPTTLHTKSKVSSTSTTPTSSIKAAAAASTTADPDDEDDDC